MTTRQFKFIIIFLFVVSAGLFIAVLNITLKSSAQSKPPTAVQQPVTQPAPKPDPGQAFVKLTTSQDSVTAGSAWNVSISSNAWSTCFADVYTPEQKVSVFADKKLAEATPVAPGSFTWIWNVPANTEKGKWTIRIICGTYDNLATADQAVEVK